MFIAGFICGVIVGIAALVVISCVINSGNIEKQLEQKQFEKGA